MTKPRNIVKVIEAIKKELKTPIPMLDEIIQKSGFRAPENQGRSWSELIYTLVINVDPESEEGKKISLIMQDKIDVGAHDE